MNAQCGRTRSIKVPADAHAVPLVRGAVCDTLRAWGTLDDHVVQTVRLIISELLTNAVLHASAATAEAVVTMEMLDDFRMRLGVHDSHPESPAPVQSDVESPHGRGLWIVQALVQELDGVLFVERAADGGKTVGIVVSVSAGASRQADHDRPSAGAQAGREEKNRAPIASNDRLSGRTRIFSSPGYAR
ncbi:ATP-binding protein [Streptomyces sp. HUAS ZL42]|uniref:ATP-binding protein n=1 Tax=Streptomyces sp. HUAS ZL42 TaxID=3231715 RepID=UPI00345EB94A